jgi:integrase
MKIAKVDSERIEVSLRFKKDRIRQVVPLEELAQWLLARQSRVPVSDRESSPGIQGPITLRAFAETHYEAYARNAAPKSWKDERGRVRFLVALLGVKLVHELGDQDFKEVARAAEKNGLKPATINRYCSRLSNMLRAARELGFIQKDAPRPSFKPLKENNLRSRIFSETEERLLLAHAQDPRFGALLRFAFNTGMRREELSTLRWSEVELGNGWANLGQTKNGRPRQVPLNSAARTALSAIPLPMRDGSVFGVSKSWISHQFKRLCKKAGIENARFHDVRRTFITRMLKAGVPEEMVRQIVGHRTHAMIARYAVLGGDFPKQCVERLVQSMETAKKAAIS